VRHTVKGSWLLNRHDILREDRSIRRLPVDQARTCRRMPTHPTVFISYSWDDEAHKGWVRQLATQLRHDGVDTRLDHWGAEIERLVT
jgi:hypothetical protein